jgi:hypothetical protein
MVVPNGSRGRRTFHEIRLPGNPRLMRKRYWNNDSISYDFENGVRVVLPREEQDRLHHLARGRRKPFAAEIQEGVVGTDWYGQELSHGADPEAP